MDPTLVMRGIRDFNTFQRDLLVRPPREDDDYWNGVMVETQMMFDALMREKNEAVPTETSPALSQTIGRGIYEGTKFLGEIFAYTAYGAVIVVGGFAVDAIIKDSPTPKTPTVELTTLTR